MIGESTKKWICNEKSTGTKILAYPHDKKSFKKILKLGLGPFIQQLLCFSCNIEKFLKKTKYKEEQQKIRYFLSRLKRRLTCGLKKQRNKCHDLAASNKDGQLPF